MCDILSKLVYPGVDPRSLLYKYLDKRQEGFSQYTLLNELESILNRDILEIHNLGSGLEGAFSLFSKMLANLNPGDPCYDYRYGYGDCVVIIDSVYGELIINDRKVLTTTQLKLKNDSKNARVKLLAFLKEAVHSYVFDQTQDEFKTNDMVNNMFIKNEIVYLGTGFNLSLNLKGK